MWWTPCKGSSRPKFPSTKVCSFIQPVELTFFLGVSAASCTMWHTDSEEHEVELELTTLTLLGKGTTSMCIAGCEETELKEPFDTAVFDPMLYHRSGLTYPHVVKLSVHWKLRSVAGTGEEAGPSGVQKEVKMEGGPDAVAAEMEELGAREDPEAVNRREELLGVQTGPAFPAPASEQKPVVKAVVQPGVGLVKVEQVPVVVKNEKVDEKVVVKKEEKKESPDRKRNKRGH